MLSKICSIKQINFLIERHINEKVRSIKQKKKNNKKVIYIKEVNIVFKRQIIATSKLYY